MSEVAVAAPRRASNISSLRSASSPVFSNDGFRNILWAGVFGSFSRGEQKESSDVDVVVVWDPAYKSGWQPHDDYFYLELKAELERVWARKVDVIDIRRGRLDTFVDVEALLTSRTLYGSEESEHVVKARREALEVVEGGIVTFANACKKIRETRAMVEGKSFEDFTASDNLRQTLRDRVNSDGPNSEYLKAIWDAVTDTTPLANNLKNFDQWTRVHVIAGGLQATKRLGAHVQKLEAEEDAIPRTSARPLHGASYLYVPELVGRFFAHVTRGAARMF